jgi:small subunit ribosomal protein S6
MSTATVSERATATDSLYEGMFLVDSGKFASDPDGVTRQILGILEKSGASIVAHRPWQDGKLAYPVEGHRKGLHYLVLFRMDGNHLPDVARACKLNETILRQIVLNHPQKLFDAMVNALNSGGPTEESAAEVPAAQGAAVES